MYYEGSESDRWHPAARRAPSSGDLGAAEPSPQGGQRLSIAALVLAISLLTFLAGAFIVLLKLPPYALLNAAYRAGEALYVQRTAYADPVETDLWFDARTPRRGVTINKAAKTYPGLTLFTSGHDTVASLIDMDGRIVHQWRKPFSEVWDESSVVSHPRPDRFVYFDKAHVFPNGDVLVVYIGVGDTPWGLGLVKLDKDSNVIWKFLERVHHDVEVGADGRIYTLTHRLRNERLEEHRFVEPPFIEDFLVILSPDGALEKKISLTEALARSPYGRFTATVPHFALQDPLHTNAVEPIEGEAAKNFPFAGEGNVLLSFRESGLIATFDPRNEVFTWGTRGPWIGQHDPDLLPNGNLLLFDNNGDVGHNGLSRVLEVDPKSMEIVWSYGGTSAEPLESVLRSEQQRLPNGNTLITESDGGRLLEVTPAGEIVWQYRNPVRADLKGTERIAIVSGGRRLAPAELDPEFLSEVGDSARR
ncbi:MAG: arylsulfotransferase family protein [Kiloniellales bacterium]